MTPNRETCEVQVPTDGQGVGLLSIPHPILHVQDVTHKPKAATVVVAPEAATCQFVVTHGPKRGVVEVAFTVPA